MDKNKLREAAKQLYRAGKHEEADAIMDMIEAPENAVVPVPGQSQGPLPITGLSPQASALVHAITGGLSGAISQAIKEATLPMGEAMGRMAAAQEQNAEVHAAATLSSRGMTDAEWNQHEQNHAVLHDHYAKPASPMGVGPDGQPNVRGDEQSRQAPPPTWPRRRR